MAEEERAEGGAWYRVYLLTWFWLLVVTALEIGVVLAGVPRGWLVTLLVVLALLKASLIAAYFMHLRYERLNLVFVVAVP
ncbi:MAG: cytochrome C oxidase subunit IV family protein, partial [Armatimonadota bacterium]|nr:cytochrome C oxidase subunit IV family protein [Armatimonadota bacterium]